MFMFTAPNPDAGTYPVYGSPYSHVQYATQIFIVLIAIICIPWMLLAKPIILYRRHKNKGYKRVSYCNESLVLENLP